MILPTFVLRPTHLSLLFFLKYLKELEIDELVMIDMPLLVQIKWYALSVFMVFAVTLSLFPSVLSHLESSNPDNTGWTGDCQLSPLLVILLLAMLLRR